MGYYAILQSRRCISARVFNRISLGYNDIFSISSIITLVLVIVQEWISFFVQLFIIFMYLCVSTYIWIMKIHGKGTKISNLKATITTLALMLIINIVMATYSVIVKHLNFELALGSASVILYILLIFLLFYQLDRVYKLIYIQKYNRQFRVAYKIPDKKWWFTAKRAAKHPRVYPPVEEGTEEPTPKEENKHG